MWFALLFTACDTTAASVAPTPRDPAIVLIRSGHAEVEAGVRITDDPSGCAEPLFAGVDGAENPLGRWCRTSGATEGVAPTEASHLALAPAGLEQDFAAHDRDEAMAAMGRLHGPAAYGASVRLAILDTSPTTGSAFQGRTFGSFDHDTFSQHGATLANLAGALLCGAGGPSTATGGPGCAAAIRTRLALPDSDVNLSPGGATPIPGTTGGTFGAVSDLSQAVVAETQAWSGAPGRGLVLSISAGFDARWTHPDPAAPTVWGAETLALFDALVYARCSGALLVAAEGNNDRSGPAGAVLYPAAWSDPATWPKAPVCSEYLGGAPGQWNATTPLIYAVGGVDRTGAPLRNALPTGSRLRGYGAATASALAPVSTPAPGSGELSTSLAGSSVATLVVAAAAAARWEAGPGSCGAPDPAAKTSPYPADQVMNDLAAGCPSSSSPPLGNVLAPGATVVVRPGNVVGDCSTRGTDVCAEPGGAPPAAFIPTPPSGIPELTCTAYPSAVNVCPSGVSAPLQGSWCALPASGCNGAPTPAGAIDCPELDPLSGTAHPWVLPQPPPPYCPYCFFDPANGVLFVKDAPVKHPTDATPASLVLRAGGQDYVYGGFDLTRTGEKWVKLGNARSDATIAHLVVYNNGIQSSCPVRVIQH